ncbi:MAG: hypothetical protein LQ349_002785 [Xanthoria aureola]|nr:MAG: hypothetical protein LQ349_002785 [Xanthoria aureola]
MDSSTAAAIAAVAIAVLAFVVALAQVLQQYFVTGSLLRLCDSTVYGSLPGRGRRIWQTNQFRFCVVYTLPQLRLERGFWEVDYDDEVELHEYPVLSEWPGWKRPPPGLITAVYASVNTNTRRALRPTGWILRTTIRKSRRLFHRFMQTSVAQKTLKRISKSLNRRDYTEFYAFLSSFRQSVHSKIAKLWTPRVVGIPKSQIDLFQPTGRRSGEASWASFTQAVQDSSWKSLRFEVAEGDVDRCPSDLSNVPMHVSLRDIVVLGLMMGMRISSRRVDIEVGQFSMVGSVGYITCSKHPILGSILHFTPSNMDATFGFGGSQRIMDLWVLRLQGSVPIAGRAYDATERSYPRDWAGPLTLATTANQYNKGNAYSKLPKPRQASESSFVNLQASSPSTHSRNSKRTGSHTADISQEAGRDMALRQALILYHQDLARETEADEKPDDRAPMKRLPPNEGEETDTLTRSQRVKYDSNPEDRSPTERSPSPPVIADEARGQLPGSQSVSYDSDPDDRSPTRRSPSSALIADQDRNSLSGSQMIKYGSHSDDRSSWRGSQSRFVIADDDRDTTYDSDANSSKLRRYESHPMHLGDEPSRARHSPSHASMERMDLMRNETAKRSQSNIAQPDEESIKNEWSQSIPDTPPQKTTTCPPGPTQNRRATIENYGEPEKPGNAHQSSDHGKTAPPGDAQGPRPLPKCEPQSQEVRQGSESRETIHESTRRPSFHDYADVVTWIWFSQMDIIPGYWATRWSWYDPGLYIRRCRGTISVVLEALSGYLNTRNLQFVSKEHELEDFLKWALLGQSTWPIYATNARGGVVVQAHYTKFEFSGFASSMAAVKLLYDHRWQTTEYTLPGSALEEYKTAELMMLDSWLSICGRQPEIRNGRSSLLHKMPNILESIEYRFGEAFSKLDQTASEGGLQHIQQEVQTLVGFLVHERLSEAEQLFTLVAMLRTAKVAVLTLEFG